MIGGSPLATYPIGRGDTTQVILIDCDTSSSQSTGAQLDTTIKLDLPIATASTVLMDISTTINFYLEADTTQSTAGSLSSGINVTFSSETTDLVGFDLTTAILLAGILTSAESTSTDLITSIDFSCSVDTVDTFIAYLVPPSLVMSTEITFINNNIVCYFISQDYAEFDSQRINVEFL